MNRLTTIAMVAAVIGPAALGSVACSRPRASAAAERPTVPVVRIAGGDLAQTLTLTAEFRPN